MKSGEVYIGDFHLAALIWLSVGCASAAAVSTWAKSTERAPSILTRLLAMHRDTSEQVWSKYATVFHHQLFAQEEKIEKLAFGRINSPCPFTLSITDVLWGCLYSLNAISVSPNTSHVPPRGMHCSGAMPPCCCCWKFTTEMYKASPAHMQEQQVDRRTISRISFVHLSNELTLAQHWASLQKVSAEAPRLSKTQTEIKHGYPTITGWPTAARP